MALLPDSKTTEDQYRTIYRDAATWLPAFRAICRRHGLNEDSLEFAPPGTHVVFSVRPEVYIKLFFTSWRDDYVAECLVLKRLAEQRHLPVPVPRVVAEGELEGWPYAIISAVEGIPLNQVFSGVQLSDRRYIAAQCGEVMAALHSTRTEGLEEIALDWPAYTEANIKASVDRLIKADAAETWVRSAMALAEDIALLHAQRFKPVLLNSDITDEHILLKKHGDRWEMAGLIDFGDSMLGHPYYDFAAPGCSITLGSPVLQRDMLLSYGFPADELNETLSKRLMFYVLAHEFINIPDLLSSFDDMRPQGMDDLRQKLWAFG